MTAYGCSPYGQPTASNIMLSEKASDRKLNHTHSRLYPFDPTDVTLDDELAAMNAGYGLILNGLGATHSDSSWPQGGLDDVINMTPYVRGCLNRWVALINALPGNVWWRPWREMTNATENLWAKEGTKKFIAGWRRVHDYMKPRCPQAKFVWCIAAHPQHPTDGAVWYPGHAYVDWVGADTYSSDNNNFADFMGALQPWYHTYYQFKPLIVCEMGDSIYDPERILRTNSVLAAMQTAYPAIKAITWWNQRGDQWAITDDPVGHLTAFRALVSDSQFKDKVSP